MYGKRLKSAYCVDRRYFAIWVVLKTHFTCRSISWRKRPISCGSNKKIKCIHCLCSLFLFTSLPSETETGREISCDGSHPGGPGNSMARMPWKAQGEGVQCPWEGGVGRLWSSCRGGCMSACRTTQLHGISRQELLLNQASQGKLLCFERSLFKWETAGAVGWFNTC